ncbi:FAD-dependent monooxygenase [Amycolatopsis sp. CA-230715]|uniref:FAD-dependent monooxygenase n=1 Tax=Amycolatopsis sp. CA-230715 TaxID=2745196 RepID=UPI001C02AE9C|nr:FAD-dependent monooxygenase [Amycolatopsis sp. CA-230715]QWF84721.1 Anhydrotetracycline monooxygenase [Amycolatopsis sp. CA-230715]
MTRDEIDVVVAGAGPVGLMQACELRLAGLRPVVLDRAAEPSTAPKANGLCGQVVDTLDHRGLLARFAEEASYSGPFPGFPFGSVPLPFAALGESPLRGMALSQPDLERLLGERAGELGVEIRWGHELTGLAQDDEGVHVDVRGPGGHYRSRARHLVGCDGARSFVRDAAGIGFPGDTDPDVLRLGHFHAETTVGPFEDVAIEVPGIGRLERGWNRTPRGRVLVTSLRAGVHIVGTYETGGPPVDSGAPLTVGELQDSVHRVLGARLPLGESIWLSRTRGQARLADRYREGRVFLAGDAAHLFPAGGSSLNVGLLDAVNLGWKLGAAITRGAPAALLDSYEAERRPVAERTLRHTRAQAALDRATGRDGEALRDLLTELFALEQPLRRLGELLHGSDTRYGDHAHPLVGRFVPELALRTETGRTRVAALLHEATPVLLDLAERPELRAIAAEHDIAVTVARCDDPPADAILIRPDGHVAFAASAQSTVDELRAVLAGWSA